MPKLPAFRALFVCLTAFLVASVAFERAAAAQVPPPTGGFPAVTFSTPHPDRLTTSGGNVPDPPWGARPQGLISTQVSLGDCIADEALTYHVVLNPAVYPTNATLTVWAAQGSDCTNAADRVGPTAVCWPVVLSVSPGATFDVKIRIQDVVAQMFANPKNSNAVVPGTKDACYQAPNAIAAGNADGGSTAATGDGGTVSTGSGPLTVSLNFIWLGGGVTGVATAAIADQLQIGLWGPSPPSGVSAATADGALTVSWTPIPSAGTTLIGYTIFCGPVAGGTSDGGGSTSTDGGDGGPATQLVCHDGGTADGGWDGAYNDAGQPIDDAGNVVNTTITLDGGCINTVVSPTGGGNCPAPPQTVCGSSNSGASSSATITDNISNGSTYSVAVGATDTFGNVGPLSQAACATPGPVLDFFQRYREDGGGAGGCALERAGAPLGSGAALLAAGASAIVAVVRRRRRRRSS